VIVVANRIPVAEGYESAFEERFQRRKGLIDHEDGFIRNLVLRPVEGDCYVVMTFWRDQEAFEAWCNSDSFRAAHGGERPPKEMFSGPNRLEVHEVIQLSEAPA
jgi:heme-degrading monooxygenase HmoA